MTREHSDEAWVIGLCDEALGEVGLREHRFPFLRGDTGRTLPVDACYPGAALVIEYHERQHMLPVPFWDRKPVPGGLTRGEQRRLYDARRAEVLPRHGWRLVVLAFSDFDHDRRGRLCRDRVADRAVIRRALVQHP